MKLFVRAARRIFSEILQFFRAILAQHLRDLDAERAPFRYGTHCRLDRLQRSFAACAAVAGRMHAVFVRAARRISGNFAISSREFGAKFA